MKGNNLDCLPTPSTCISKTDIYIHLYIYIYIKYMKKLHVFPPFQLYSLFQLGVNQKRLKFTDVL